MTQEPLVNNTPGKLIAVEGLDGSGKSTQVYLLKRWLELSGYKVFFTEWNSSEIVRSATKRGKKQNLLTPTTFSLIHCTDFADRYERNILPMLKAGFIVLADRYIYTLMARDMVRGADLPWLQSVYSIALVPDLVMYLRVAPQKLMERYIYRARELDYWESGMDIGYSRSWYDSFIRYQSELHRTFNKLQAIYGFATINGMRVPRAITRDLQTRIEAVLSPDG